MGLFPKVLVELLTGYFYSCLLSHLTLFKSQSDQPESEEPRTNVESSAEFDCVQSSASHQRFDDILMTYYVPLEVWYIRSVIEKVRLHILKRCFFR
jgi:hypothetical protein